MPAELDDLVAHFPGQVGYWLENLATGEVFSHQPDRSFLAASTIKLPLLWQTLEEGHRLEQILPIRADQRALGSGVIKDLQVDALSLQDLLTLMITVSDNTATNVVIDLLGHKMPINAWLGQKGWTSTYLAGKLSMPEDRPDHQRLPNDAARTSAADLASMLRRLWNKEINHPLVLDILGRQQFSELLRELPTDPDHLEELTSPLQVYSKSGWLREYRHDAGILSRGTGAVVVVGLTHSTQDLRFHPDHQAHRLLGSLAGWAYQRWLA
jgi:beta-lactamase class A